MYTDEFLGPLVEFVPEIPHAQEFIEKIEQEREIDITILDRVYVQDLVVSEEEGQPVIEFALAIEGETELSIPGLSFISILFGATIPGYTFLRSYLSIGPNGYLYLYDFKLAIEIHQPFLKSYDLESETISSNDFRFELDSGIGIDVEANIAVDFYDFDIPPFTIAETGLILALENCNLDLGSLRTPDDLLDFVGEPEFNGIYAESALLYWLPEFQVPYAPFKGIELDLENIALDQLGISFKFDLQWEVVHDGVQIAAYSDFVGYLFEDRLALAIASAEGEVFHNTPRSFIVSGVVQLPFLPSLLGIEFSLEGNFDDSSFETSLSLEKLLEAPIVIDLGAPDHTLSIRSLALDGVLQNDGFTLYGVTGFDLHLPGFNISVEQAELMLIHAPEGDALHFELTNVELGLLGVVEQATFKINFTRTTDGDTALKDFYIEVALEWEDALKRLNLDQLPDFMPRPPDDAVLTAVLNWQESEWKLRFTAALTDIDNLWSFIPLVYRPEVRQASFVFEAQQKEANDTFTGEASLAVSLQLPELPNFAGNDLFTITTGDADGWIEAAFGATISDSNTEDSASLKATIATPFAIAINFPGIPQNTPPIYIDITQIDLSIGQEGDDNTGRFVLSGNFSLRPINPADTALPLPPVMATHIEHLFRPLTVSPFEGKASLTVQFAEDKAAMNLNASFTEASIEVDLFDMLASVTRGIPAPEGLDNPANSIDLDIDVGFALDSLGIQIGSLEQSSNTQEEFKFEFAIDLLLMGQQIPIRLSLSDQQVSFGITEMTVPLSIPRFPFKLQDMEDLVGNDGLWDYDNIWLSDASTTIATIDPATLDFSAPLLEQIEAQIEQHLILTEGEIDALITLLKTEKNKTEQEIAALSSADNGDTNRLRDLKTKVIPNLNQEGIIFAAKKFMIQSVFAIYNLVGADARPVFRTYFAHYQELMDNTVGLVYADTDLLLRFKNVNVVLPFHDPSDIRVEGSAQFEGFEAHSPLDPLNEMSLSVGLSADLIYLAFEGSESPLVLPPYDGRYEGTEVVLDHLRIGYGYNKNSFAVSFAGQLELPENLVQDADTSEEIGIGIRLPQESRLAFKLDLIPIVLGQVDFLLPLFKFDIDLRREGAPGIADPRTCEPYWDGLQLHIPGVFRGAYKRAQFSPFYGPLPAPNISYSYDLVFGSDDSRMAFVCDDYQQIMPVLGKFPIPFMADGIPYFENQCVNIRVAGFGLNVNLQRPMPSLSPLAVFEIIGLIADPSMPIAPHGSLAETMRVTLQHAQISFPPAVVSMFPELGNIVDREVNYDLNLGTVVYVAQQINHYIEALKELTETQLQTATSPSSPHRPLQPTRQPNTARMLGSRVSTARISASRIATSIIRFGPRPLSTSAQDPNFVEQLRQQLTAKAPPITASEILALLPPDLRQIELNGSFIGFDATVTFLLLTREELSQEFSKRSQITFSPTPPTFPYNPEDLTPPDFAQLQGYQPQWSEHAALVALPADPQHNLLNSELFNAFSDRDIQFIDRIQPDTEASAVVVGGQVRIFEAQSYAFMGYMYSDGHFGLISAANIEPLEVTVAGMTLPLPLQIQGRLALNGLASGADSYAKVTAAVKVDWEIIPGFAELFIGMGRPFPQPATFELDSRGHFAAKGRGVLFLFNRATTVYGQIDISHTHCHIDGKLLYKSEVEVYRKPLVDLQLTTKGRIGPGADLKLSGTGSLYIAGNEITGVKGLVSTTGAEIEGQINTETWKMGSLPIQQIRLGLRGKIDLQNRQSPKFLLEGDAYLRLFDQPTSSNRLEIEGRGGIQASSEGLTTFITGKVIWQDQEWLQGQIRLHPTNGIHIEGYTSFGLILTPNRVGSVEVASLYFKLNLGGTVDISPRGSFKCNLTLDWDLGVRLPGNEEQVLLLAGDTVRLPSNLSRRPRKLVNLNGFKLLPLEGWDLSLPIPEIHGEDPPVLKLGTKNNLIAVDVQQVGTLYFDEYEFVNGLTGGSLPSLSRGSLPSLSGGKLPSWTLSEGFKAGDFPTLNPGTLPELEPGILPTPSKTSLPIPKYQSHNSSFSFDDPDSVVSLYKNYSVDWKNQNISINFSTFSTSPIKFGIEKENYRFYVQIAGQKYALNGEEL